MHPSANTAGGRRVTRWTRETIIEKIREWNDRYGEPPCSADWNPSLARWRAQEWRAERYREGIWPSTNAAKRPFDGSFDAAVRAAGTGASPLRPAPSPGRCRASRRRAARADGSAQRRRGAGRGRRARALAPSVASPRWSGRWTRLSAVRRVPRICWTTRVPARAVPAIVSAVRGWRASACGWPSGSLPSRPRNWPRTRTRVVRAAYDQAAAAVADTLEARRAALAAESRAADAEARAEAAERLLAATEAARTAANGSERSAPGMERQRTERLRTAQRRTARPETARPPTARR